MKKVFINIYADLGIDCKGGQHDFEDSIVVMITDETAHSLTRIACNQGHEVEARIIEERLPEFYEDLNRDVSIHFHEMMVIQGWKDHGWDACSKYIDDLIEEDIENGDFVFDCPEDIDDEDAYEDVRQEAWEEAENKKMDAMSVSELSEYLEDRYGVDTDFSGMNLSWSLILM